MQQYDQRVRDAIAAVPQGAWKEFASYAGPGPERITGWDKVVLIGDASHPLHGMPSVCSAWVKILIAPSLGAFGSGATFGMEDGWVLAQALELEHSRGSERLVRDTLQIFEEIRLPYYQRMWVHPHRSHLPKLIIAKLTT